VPHLHEIAGTSFGIRYNKYAIEHVLVCLKVTYVILVAIQNLKSTSNSLRACSVPSASVRHQDKYTFLGLAIGFGYIEMHFVSA